MYEGEWKLGKMNGEFIYTNAKGLERQGTWDNGKRTHWLDEEIDLFALGEKQTTDRDYSRVAPVDLS